jgi:hypothetical protein
MRLLEEKDMWIALSNLLLKGSAFAGLPLQWNVTPEAIYKKQKGWPEHHRCLGGRIPDAGLGGLATTSAIARKIGGLASMVHTRLR